MTPKTSLQFILHIFTEQCLKNWALCFISLWVHNIFGVEGSGCCFKWSAADLWFCQTPSAVTSPALMPWPILTTHPRASFTLSCSFFFPLSALPFINFGYFHLLRLILFPPFSRSESIFFALSIHLFCQTRGTQSAISKQFITCRIFRVQYPSLHLNADIISTYCLSISVCCSLNYNTMSLWPEREKAGSMFSLWFGFMISNFYIEKNIKKLVAKLKKNLCFQHVFHYRSPISFPNSVFVTDSSHFSSAVLNILSSHF